MAQMVLPIFPKDITFINNNLAFCRNDGSICYFYGGPNPVFTHDETDIQTFRMIVSQFYITGKASQSEIIKAFAIPSITLKRCVKLYREQGPAGFYKPIVRIRGAAILTKEVIGKVEELLANGETLKRIAGKLDIKYDTLYRAVKVGKIKKK